nr:hypothetical protein [Tanacetum cinerariifolium]
MCLHFTRNHKELKSNTPYPKDSIRRIQDYLKILKDIKRDPESRRKYFTANRVEENKNKPPTKAQQKSLMCTDLKNMEGYKQKDLKGKSFNAIKKMFDKAYKRVNTFVAMDADVTKGSSSRAVEGSKRAGEELESDKEDLEVLWGIVKARFEKTKPVDDMDILLLHTLKTMFEHHVEDTIWKYQQGLYKVKIWKLYDSSADHEGLIKEVITETMTDSTLEEYKTRGDYYSSITKMMINGKAAYELKGKFLDDLRNKAFSGIIGEDAVEHIEHFLKIVDPLYLPNKKDDDQEVLTNEVFFDPKETYKDEEHEIAEIFMIKTGIFDFETPLCMTFNEFNCLFKYDIYLFTYNIQGAKTYEKYKNELNNDPEEPWSENRVPYELIDHICKPFRFKNRKTKWPTCSLNDDGFCNGGVLPRMVRFGYMAYFQDYNCAPYHANEEEKQYKEYRCLMLGNPRQEQLVYKNEMFDLIKYSFGPAKKYIAIKEYEHDDLKRANEDACHAYQEIFRVMDEGWFMTKAE